MKKRTQIGRRRFIQAVPAAVATSVALPTLVPPAVSAQGRGGGAPPKFGKDALKGAEEESAEGQVGPAPPAPISRSWPS